MQSLVQFRGISGSRQRHIGSHIVGFCKVWPALRKRANLFRRGGDMTFPRFD